MIERVAVIVLALSALLAASLVAADKAADKPVTAAELASWVDKRVKDWQPVPEEKRFDEIGWTHMLVDAEKLARESRRPIFWFTHDGKMQVGRC